LLAAAGGDELGWGAAADGYGGGVCDQFVGDCVVHVQQQWDVLRCGEDEGDEGTGGVSAGLVLCRVWDYGDIFE